MSSRSEGKPLSFRAEPALVAAVEAEAMRLGITTSAACRLLVERALEHQALELRLRELERGVTERMKEAALLLLLNFGRDHRQVDVRELRLLVDKSVRPSHGSMQP
jgi:antitoxin component of RelBE/YafQ-DinJ toxin-antitoxin module